MPYGFAMTRTERPARDLLKTLCAAHSISEVAVKLGCHRATAWKWAIEAGLIERQRPYSYDLPSGSQLRQLCLTNSDADLARMYGCSEAAIGDHRHASGIFRSRVRRRYTLDETFFEKINTEEKAYALGFISADGCVPLNGRSVKIEIHTKDVHILRDMRAVMGSNARVTVAKRGPYALIYFSSQKLVADLATHGVGPRKSLTLQFPKLPKRLERHYLRGLLDGDGCIREKSFYFLGTESIIDGARASILSHTGIRLSKTQHDNLWLAVGCGRSREVLRWLYDEASIFLRRKHHRFLKHWS